jgi:chromosome segregation ATPase
MIPFTELETISALKEVTQKLEQDRRASARIINSLKEDNLRALRQVEAQKQDIKTLEQRIAASRELACSIPHELNQALAKLTVKHQTLKEDHAMLKEADKRLLAYNDSLENRLALAHEATDLSVNYKALDPSV